MRGKAGRKRFCSIILCASLMLSMCLSDMGTVPVIKAAGESGGSTDENYGLSNPVVSSGVTTWDCVYFGNYWQNDTDGNGKANSNDSREAIKWRVLSVNGDDAFLMADQVLDCHLYHTKKVTITWENCSLRDWLNNEFYNNSFSNAEQGAIMTTTVLNSKNGQIAGGNATSDKVYLLSLDEAKKYVYGFSTSTLSDSNRCAKNTAYAIAQGVTGGNYASDKENGAWWLRSPGTSAGRASFIYTNGMVGDSGLDVNYTQTGVGVRPVLHLNLSCSVWSSAGTVDSNGNIGESMAVSTATPTVAPTATPTVAPTATPTATPTVTPTATPTAVPTPTLVPVPTDIKKSKNAVNDPTTDSDGVTTWDCVYFGSYWQNDTNGDGKADRKDDKTPIKWRVLSVDGEEAYLLADKCLACRPYHSAADSVTWETCELRSWLNGSFYEEAFSDTQQNAIILKNVENKDNTYFTSPLKSAEGGNNTNDYVGLLSMSEIGYNKDYGFAKYNAAISVERCSKATEYAQNQGIDMTSSGRYAGNVYWWLRSPGYSSLEATYISYTGFASHNGINVCTDCYGVRPVLHLDLTSSEWSDAGMVDSEGKVTRPVELPESGYGIDSPEIASSDVTTWDCIYFGEYWQNDTNEDSVVDQNDEKQPIKWRVLSVDGDVALLLADQCLDCKPFMNKTYSATWEVCSLRSWLNGDFYKTAFSSTEQKYIKWSRNVNEDNVWKLVVNGVEHTSWIEGGNDTKDKIYLLSKSEITTPEYGLSKSKSRAAGATAYAVSQGVDLSSTLYPGNSSWWLRSIGQNNIYAHCVEQYSIIMDSGIRNYESDIGVRPVLQLKLSSPVWSNAGTIDSNGQGTDSSTNPVIQPVEEETDTSQSSDDLAYAVSNPSISNKGVSTWKSIYFGKYWQEDTNGDTEVDENDEKQPIKWRVLSVDGTDAFLLADKILDYRSYDTKNVLWESCSLRTWLNEDFYENAFDDEEKDVIKWNSVFNGGNSSWSAGSDTRDRIYLLSALEAVSSAYGFSAVDKAPNTFQNTRETSFAAAQKKDKYPTAVVNLYWWLRTPLLSVSSANGYSWSVNCIEKNGRLSSSSLCSFGAYTGARYLGVRPVLRIDLSSFAWKDAGIVNSNGLESDRTTKLAIYSRTDTSSESIADVSVSTDFGEEYYVGDTATVKAPDKSGDGCRFLGWYEVVETEDGKVTEYGEKVSDKLTYSFELPEENTGLVAVYQPNKKAVVTVKTVNGAAYYAGEDMENLKAEEEESMPVTAGTIFTLTAADSAKVFQWQNESGKVLGTGKTLKLTVTGDITVTLIYCSEKENQAYVQFVSDYGQVISGEQYQEEETIIFPSAPTKFGFIFRYWTLDGTTEASGEDIKKQMAEGVKTITLKPYYEQEQKIGSVIVNYLSDEKSIDEMEPDEFEELEYGSIKTISARELDGYVFECWKDTKGNVLSYKEEYYVRITGDIVLNACYAAEETVVEVRPVIAITDFSAVDEGDIHKISCEATRNVPEGYTLLEHGMLYGVRIGDLTEDTFVYGTDGVYRNVSDSTISNGIFRLTNKVLSDELIVYYRAYMVLKNESTGNQEYHYSGIVSGSYESLGF